MWPTTEWHGHIMHNEGSSLQETGDSGFSAGKLGNQLPQRGRVTLLKNFVWSVRWTRMRE